MNFHKDSMVYGTLKKRAVWRSGRRARKAVLMSLADMYIKVPNTFY